MSEEGKQDCGEENTPTKNQDDWTAYAQAGFGESELDPWDDLVVVESTAKTEGIELESEDAWGVARPPDPSGVDALVRLGTCDYCLGRCGGRTTLGKTNEETGKELRKESIQRDPNHSERGSEEDFCPFCEDLFSEIDLVISRITNQLDDVEAKSIQIGIKVPKDQIQSDEDLRKKNAGPGSEPLKPALQSALGARLTQVVPGVKLVNEDPDLLALVDTLTLSVSLDIRPLFLYGRYQKHERGIPQTRWPCKSCKGRSGGCERCEGTGLQYRDSVQDLIGKDMGELFEATNTSFHGMGREDIDVRCLGDGRPFVMEMKNPKKRFADLEKLQQTVNEHAQGRVIISTLRWSKRKEVVRIKGTAAEKSYRVHFKMHPKQKDGWYDPEELLSLKKSEIVEIAVELGSRKSGTKAEIIEGIIVADRKDEPLPNEEEIKKVVEGLAGVTLAQRTPKRVSHRRADKVRERKIYSVHLVSAESPEVSMDIRAESGTYIKEMVHGDDGRTDPSLSDLLGVKCEVLALDVADIHAD